MICDYAGEGSVSTLSDPDRGNLGHILNVSFLILYSGEEKELEIFSVEVYHRIRMEWSSKLSA